MGGGGRHDVNCPAVIFDSVTSVGLSDADPLAGIRALFDISSRLLRSALAYARALLL